jgi:periplasmic copper chaperone A
MTRFASFACAAVAAALFVSTAPAGAQHYAPLNHGAHGTAAGIEIADGWARASAGQARAGAAYMSLRNTGDAEDRLTGAETPAASRTEIHTHIKDGTIMRMREVEGGIVLPPGKTVTLEPGGLHVMLIGLTQPLQEGETFPLTLKFEKAGDKTVEIAVRGVAAGTPHKPAHGHGGGHGGRGH